jgi:pantoate--beta-alanine ligase
MMKEGRPRVLTRPQEIQAAVKAYRADGLTTGVVPTMGALHEGHISLVKAANAACDITIATIFVNPAQFAPTEDLATYPRTLTTDLEMLASNDVDLVFVPANAEMYPDGFSTYVEPPAVAKRWEGESRPGFFRGVATVVLKLFHLIPTDMAFFGQKDFQQALVIRRMVEDLNVPIEIRTQPTVREADGLAMSSRNRYLSQPEREQSLALSRGLAMARSMAEGGERSGKAMVDGVRRVLTEAGIHAIDYVAVADPETLEPVAEVTGPVVVLIAARVGTTRLIDNAVVGPAVS